MSRGTQKLVTVVWSRSAGDVRTAVTNARRGGKRTVMMHVQSGAKSRFVAVPVG